MTPFDTAIKQARVALSALAEVKLCIGRAYATLDQDTDWSEQSHEAKLEAQRLSSRLISAYYAIEREEAI